MSVQRANYSQIPRDAVVLSEDDAIEYQLNFITEWENKKDTWIFRNGIIILSSISALTSAYINNHYRTKLRLLSYGRISSYLPVVIIPSLVSALFHQQFVVHDIILQRSCPVCVQIRSASLQCAVGAIFPAVIAPLAALPFAIRYLTYNVPSITTDPKKVYQMLYRHTKPIANTFMGLLAVNGLVAALIAYQETKSFFNIQTKLNEFERKYQLEHGS